MSAPRKATRDPAHTPPSPAPEKAFLSVNETCARYGIGRTTFYRMLGDPTLDLASILIRIPPGSGRIKVPVRTFEAWLARKSRGHVTQLEGRGP